MFMALSLLLREALKTPIVFWIGFLLTNKNCGSLHCVTNRLSIRSAKRISKQNARKWIHNSYRMFHFPFLFINFFIKTNVFCELSLTRSLPKITVRIKDVESEHWFIEPLIPTYCAMLFAIKRCVEDRTVLTTQCHWPFVCSGVPQVLLLLLFCVHYSFHC